MQPEHVALSLLQLLFWGILLRRPELSMVPWGRSVVLVFVLTQTSWVLYPVLSAQAYGWVFLGFAVLQYTVQIIFFGTYLRRAGRPQGFIWVAFALGAATALLASAMWTKSGSGPLPMLALGVVFTLGIQTLTISLPHPEAVLRALPLTLTLLAGVEFIGTIAALAEGTTFQTYWIRPYIAAACWAVAVLRLRFPASTIQERRVLAKAYALPDRSGSVAETIDFPWFLKETFGPLWNSSSERESSLRYGLYKLATGSPPPYPDDLDHYRLPELWEAAQKRRPPHRRPSPGIAPQ